MADLTCKLVIIGAGPGGYVCGIRAGQLGIDTIVVEADRPGGTCLNVGCIPSKALIHAADEFHRLRGFAERAPLGISAASPAIDLAATMAWKDAIVARLNAGVSGLLKKAGTRLIRGEARFLDGKTVAVDDGEKTLTIGAENVVIATGSSPIELPALPFGGKVISSSEALALQEVPESLAIVGGGYIGLEIGTAFAKLGARVAIVEAMDHILPHYDTALSAPVVRALQDLGVSLMTGARASGTTPQGLRVENSEGVATEIAAEYILVTVGRRPRTDSANIADLDLSMEGAFIDIDDQCRTSMHGVYAIGDVTGEPMLAHRAMAQGEMVAEIIAGRRRAWDKVGVPAVCFTDPEIVTCGVSPDAAKAMGIAIVTGQFPFTANGRAMTMEAETGFVRAVARRDNGLVIGLQAVGTGISELSAAFSIALEMGATLEDVGAVIHAHPTQSEALQEACLKALGHALHI